jgi:hypothetical protein
MRQASFTRACLPFRLPKGGAARPERTQSTPRRGARSARCALRAARSLAAVWPAHATCVRACGANRADGPVGGAAAPCAARVASQRSVCERQAKRRARRAHSALGPCTCSTSVRALPAATCATKAPMSQRRGVRRGARVRRTRNAPTAAHRVRPVRRRCWTAPPARRMTQTAMTRAGELRVHRPWRGSPAARQPAWRTGTPSRAALSAAAHFGGPRALLEAAALLLRRPAHL